MSSSRFIAAVSEKGGATVTTETDSLTSSFTTTSITIVDVTGLSIAITNVSGGQALITSNFVSTNDNSGEGLVAAIADDGTVVARGLEQKQTAGDYNFIGISAVVSTNGSTMTAQTISNGTVLVTVLGQAAGSNRTDFMSLEIS